MGVPFPFGGWGRIWNSIVLVPDHCLFIYFELVLSVLKRLPASGINIDIRDATNVKHLKPVTEFYNQSGNI